MKNIYQFSNLTLQKQCHHLISQKDFNAPYQCSLALHTQEDPKKILENRDNLRKNFPSYHFIGANQTHSANIFIVKESVTLGWNSLDDAIQNFDALITNKPNIMLTILTADCVPILLVDPVQNVIAAVHAGWKGTKEQILRKTIKSMQKNFNTLPKDVISGIGPSIGECCYEVDWNVAQHFSEIEDSYLKRGEKYMLNLPYINKHQLLKAGLEEKNIEMSHVCTACQSETYFSYRKEGGCSGRFISMIGLK